MYQFIQDDDDGDVDVLVPHEDIPWLGQPHIPDVERRL